MDETMDTMGDTMNDLDLAKTCTKCSVDKPLENFYKNKNGLFGRLATCKDCTKQAVKDNLLDPERAERKRERDRLLKNGYVKKNRDWVNDYLKNNPCVDCGEDDWIVLEFDHVRGEKEMEVSLALYRGWSLEKIKKEIEKCEVRCANCHRRVTYQRRQNALLAGIVTP